VGRELTAQMPAAGPASRSLSTNGGIVLTRTMAEAIALCQSMAPEHVVCDSDSIAAKLTRAGTIFVGDHSAQASGDYATGSNHVLPTSGAARARGGLSAADFVRVSTVQRLSVQGIRRIGPAAVALARAEGLSAHAASIELRLGLPAPKGPAYPRAPKGPAYPRAPKGPAYPRADKGPAYPHAHKAPAYPRADKAPAYTRPREGPAADRKGSR
jgi:hypothetical protein